MGNRFALPASESATVTPMSKNAAISTLKDIKLKENNLASLKTSTADKIRIYNDLKKQCDSAREIIRNEISVMKQYESEIADLKKELRTRYVPFAKPSRKRATRKLRRR